MFQIKNFKNIFLIYLLFLYFTAIYYNERVNINVLDIKILVYLSV